MVSEETRVHTSLPKNIIKHKEEMKEQHPDTKETPLTVDVCKENKMFLLSMLLSIKKTPKQTT